MHPVICLFRLLLALTFLLTTCSKSEIDLDDCQFYIRFILDSSDLLILPGYLPRTMIQLYLAKVHKCLEMFEKI